MGLTTDTSSKRNFTLKIDSYLHFLQIYKL